MKKIETRPYQRIRHTALVLVCLASFFSVGECMAQEMPPRPTSVAIVRNLSFGAFTQGMGSGSVLLYPSGMRSSAGDVVLVNMGYAYFPAIFELEGNPGTVMHFLAGPDALLAGSNGGSMTMSLGDTEPLTPFILPPLPNGTLQVFIGGSLTVGDPMTNPPGNYSGSFIVMFIQE